MNFNVIMAPSFLKILLLGSVAGFTIYLGLPFALLRSKGLRTFANSLSVGVLIFILVEVLEKAFDGVREKVMGSLTQGEPWSIALVFIMYLLVGVAGAYLGLVYFEQKWMRNTKDGVKSAGSLAMIIAIGIGLHNFSEGLAIGQELAGGAVALGVVLAVGFAMHNATEGFGIAAPLTAERPSLLFLFWLGLIGGGPTVLGTAIGATFVHPGLEVFFLSLAAGAILYVIAELIHIGKTKGGHVTIAMGILVGLFIAFGSDVFIDGATALAKHPHH